MLANDYISHWELSGLKPYMRYTLAGGSNYESENLFFLSTTGGASQQNDPRTMLDKAEEALMDSPGHRATILGPRHRKVSLGIAYNSNHLALVQQFEGDYVTFSKAPVINSGVLSLSGELSGGLEIEQIQIWYDQPPAPLTLGQLGKSSVYWRGKPAAFIRPPPPSGGYYLQYEMNFSWQTSVDPYAVPADTPAPDSSAPAETAPSPVTVSDTVRWIDAKSWNVSGGFFTVEADLSGILERFNAGIYTMVVWTKSDGDSFIVSNYSLFVL
ncbi:MAG: hypothetical protein HYX84_04430 [Chloroflexi bacterium]|nr:hypothetical protein [Chloroflexota bacterium]